MPTLSVKITKDLGARLAALARKRGTTRSAVVREALESWEGVVAGSFAERARDLRGTVDGPRDLSTNPRHLAGLGRR